MAGRGRPKKEDSRNGQYRLRMNAEEERMLDETCRLTGKTKAEVLRRALKAAYNLAKTANYWDSP